MQYEVKSFKDHNPQSGTAGFTDKDSEATAWLNHMASQGYRLVALTSSPIYLSQPLSTTNIANSITSVVEKTEASGAEVL
jgi:hypothetical protein